MFTLLHSVFVSCYRPDGRQTQQNFNYDDENNMYTPPRVIYV